MSFRIKPLLTIVLLALAAGIGLAKHVCGDD